MSIGNAVVGALLRSPFHRAMSGSIDLIRYTGRRSGRVITTPTQYATHGDDEPETVWPLLETYLARFPRAARSLDGTSSDERVRRSVVVECRPR